MRVWCQCVLVTQPAKWSKNFFEEGFVFPWRDCDTQCLIHLINYGIEVIIKEPQRSPRGTGCVAEILNRSSLQSTCFGAVEATLALLASCSDIMSGSKTGCRHVSTPWVYPVSGTSFPLGSVLPPCGLPFDLAELIANSDPHSGWPTFRHHGRPEHKCRLCLMTSWHGWSSASQTSITVTADDKCLVSDIKLYIYRWRWWIIVSMTLLWNEWLFSAQGRWLWHHTDMLIEHRA